MSDRFKFEGAVWNLEVIKRALEGKKEGIAHMVVWDKTTQGYHFWFKWHYTGTNDAEAREYLRRVLDAAAAVVPSAAPTEFDPLKPVKYRGIPDYELRFVPFDLSGERPLVFAAKRRGGSEEYITQRRADGRAHADRETPCDVVNWTPKKTGWLAHWQSGNERHTSQIYDTREEAELCTHVPNAVIMEIPEYEP